MTEQTLEKANEIKGRIDKLKKEVFILDNCAGHGHYFWRIFCVKKVPFIRCREKVHYEEYFALENEDVIALQDRRIKLISELQKEFEELKFYSESEAYNE